MRQRLGEVRACGCRNQMGREAEAEGTDREQGAGSRGLGGLAEPVSRVGQI